MTGDGLSGRNGAHPVPVRNPTPPRLFTAGSRFGRQASRGRDGFVAFYQPIQNLRTGRVAGFEVLARLRRGGAVLTPDSFLSDLTPADHIRLFRTMFGQALALFKAARAAGHRFHVSVNADSSLVATDGFLEAVEPVLLANPGFARHLVVEILEGEPIADYARAAAVFTALREFGVHVAVDDVGSAYSSLLNLKDLPVDVFKLDQGFARGLERKPDDLLFVVSLLSLARGLGKILVVEGAETPAVLDALRILGVDYAQGYAIAQPMPGEAVLPWLRGADAAAARPDGPQTLLGVYASHLAFVETCRVVAPQPMQVEWSAEARDPHRCPIGRHFGRHGLHDTPMGRAHARVHAVMTQFRSDRAAWDAAMDDFYARIKEAMASGPAVG